MNLQITVENYHLSDRQKLLIDTKISRKIDRLLIKFSSDLKIAQLKIQRGKLGIFTVSFDMTLPGKEHIYASSRHLILRSTLIHLEHQISRQLEKYKSHLLSS